MESQINSVKETPSKNKMSYMKRLVFVIIGALFTLIILSFGWRIFNNNDVKLLDTYSAEIALFDKYIKASKLPIIDNQDSLCNGLYVSTDFSKVAPKYAVAKLIDIKAQFEYTFVFKGKNETGEMVIPISKDELPTYEIGQYYRIDMMNICRNSMMMADNMSPSRIKETFVKPFQITPFKGNVNKQGDFTKVGTFTTNVDQTLINSGIDYVKDYYVLGTKKDFPLVDVTITKQHYECKYTKAAKDDQYLYINLTCIGDALGADGKKLDASLTNFSENPTRLKYTYSNQYSLSEMDQPISPDVYDESFPQEYIKLLQQ